MKNVYTTLKNSYMASFWQRGEGGPWSWRWRVLDPYTESQWLDIGVGGHNCPTRKAAKRRAVELLEQELGYGR